MKQKSRLFTGYDLQKYAPVFLMLVLMLILTIANKNFLTGQSIYNLLSQVAALGIVALGSMLVLLTAGIDFTAGFGLSLAGVTAGVVYISSGDKGWVLVLVSVLTGAVVGLLNGLIIVGLKLNPFIATLAMMTVCKGISMMVSEGRQVQITSPGLLKLGSGKLFGFLPIAFILFAAVIFIIYLILNKTKLGIYTYAIGGNEDAVAYSGINKDLYKVFVYVTAWSLLWYCGNHYLFTGDDHNVKYFGRLSFRRNRISNCRRDEPFGRKRPRLRNCYRGIYYYSDHHDPELFTGTVFAERSDKRTHYRGNLSI